jgi:hypothetical protein
MTSASASVMVPSTKTGSGNLKVRGRAHRVLRVPGVLDPARGRPRREASSFKTMLGLKN